MTNSWDKILTEDFEAALEIADKNYKQSANEFDLRARAICSLLLKRYKDALKDFLELNEIEKKSNSQSDETYMNIGLCYYALDEIDNSIEYFTYPITNRKEIKYTNDISVPPIILLLISKIYEKIDLTKIALKELKRLSKHQTPAINYILGKTNANDLIKISNKEKNKTLKNRLECKTSFYIAVLSKLNGDENTYRNQLEICEKLKGHYLEFEYYIASVELHKINSR